MEDKRENLKNKFSGIHKDKLYEQLKKFMTDWAVSYFRNKDLIKNEIVEIATKDIFIIKYKNKSVEIFIKPKLEDFNVSEIDKEKDIAIITLNNRENIGYLIKLWAALMEFRKLCIFFINPFSAHDKKWVIFPYVHNKICDKNSFARGLYALAENIEPISVEDFTRKI